MRAQLEGPIGAACGLDLLLDSCALEEEAHATGREQGHRERQQVGKRSKGTGRDAVGAARELAGGERFGTGTNDANLASQETCRASDLDQERSLAGIRFD